MNDVFLRQIFSTFFQSLFEGLKMRFLEVFCVCIHSCEMPRVGKIKEGLTQRPVALFVITEKRETLFYRMKK